MDHGNLAAQVFDLVALQAADEMPFRGGGDLVDLGDTFLDVTFAEQGLACRYRRLDVCCGFLFGDSNQANLFRAAPAFSATGSYVFANPGNVG